MATVSYDRPKWHPARRGAQGKSVGGPYSCDKIRKGDLIRVGDSERKVRVVFRDEETGFITSVWVVKLRPSGYPSPVTSIGRYRLRSATVVEEGVSLYSTPLEARCQLALERHVRELTEKPIGEREFQARDEVTESDVVHTLI